MQTSFSPEQLADPATAEAERIVRKCVHCGLCTATCPTYVTLGNELDSPRGRIYLIKDMFENGRDADKDVATHVDRCLSCLACTTTCPSGVDYMHLIDLARNHVEKTYRRPLADRMIRSMLAFVIPHRNRFRLALKAAGLGRPLSGLFRRLPGLAPLAAMLDLAPRHLPTTSIEPSGGSYMPRGARRGRVILQVGCVQPVLQPSIHEATIELLTGLGIEVVIAEGEGCCGSLVHHMGRNPDARAAAKAVIAKWLGVSGDVDAIIVTASGCGTTIKDYAHLLADEADWSDKAARVAGLAKDITEYLASLDLPALEKRPERVTYHAACSLQHGQKITEAPKRVLERAGFTVRQPAESHLCCGSAGTYNMLQPDISATLKDRKVKNIAATKPDVIAAGNIGCITQIASGMNVPVVHTVELVNWAYGGRKPKAFE